MKKFKRLLRFYSALARKFPRVAKFIFGSKEVDDSLLQLHEDLVKHRLMLAKLGEDHDLAKASRNQSEDAQLDLMSNQNIVLPSCILSQNMVPQVTQEPAELEQANEQDHISDGELNEATSLDHRVSNYVFSEKPNHEGNNSDTEINELSATRNKLKLYIPIFSQSPSRDNSVMEQDHRHEESPDSRSSRTLKDKVVKNTSNGSDNSREEEGSETLHMSEIRLLSKNESKKVSRFYVNRLQNRRYSQEEEDLFNEEELGRAIETEGCPELFLSAREFPSYSATDRKHSYSIVPKESDTSPEGKAFKNK